MQKAHKKMNLTYFPHASDLDEQHNLEPWN
jgi:hypothetical protein